MKKLLLLALALPGLSTFAAAAAPAPAPDGAEFAVAHRLVDIGGRKLNLFCSGMGSPTVVFEAPSATPGWSWWAVQPQVAAQTRACVYDRAGFGFSDPSPHPADARNAVDDLHALLQAAGIAPPYVLVGNSFGGASAQMFAWRYPAEVQGLVLAEPMHEDENARADVLTHGGITQVEARILEVGNDCMAQAASKGFTPKTRAYEDCIGGADPALAGALAEADLKQRLTATWWATRQAERTALAADRAQLRAARQPFGDLPVIVLVRDVSPYLIAGQPPSDTNKAIEAANLELLTALARSSKSGEVRVVHDAGHEIQETEPQAVVTAVDDLLARIRH
jgi:pimeloyl-ACP methyl ester carboxylesterase